MVAWWVNRAMNGGGGGSRREGRGNNGEKIGYEQYVGRSSGCFCYEKDGELGEEFPYLSTLLRVPLMGRENVADPRLFVT